MESNRKQQRRRIHTCVNETSAFVTEGREEAEEADKGTMNQYIFQCIFQLSVFIYFVGREGKGRDKSKLKITLQKLKNSKKSH